MTNLTKISALVLTALVASTSLASAGGGIKLPPIPNLSQAPQPNLPLLPIPVRNLPVEHHKQTTPNVDCDVRDPMATTDDLWIVNIGNVELPAGTRLSYSVPSSGDRGGFLLPHSIQTGEKLKVSDLLHDARSGAPCTVKIMM